MKKFKKFLLSGILLRLLALILLIYIKFCYVTARWNFSGHEILAELKKKKQPALVCFWHGRMMLAFSMVRYSGKTNVISSRSKDGDITSAIMKGFGLGVVRGSSNSKGKNRGGTAALRDAVRTLRGSENIALTPDGPRGPRMRVSGRVIEIAELAGVPIVPTAQAASPSRILGTWDRFMLLLPFSKIEVKIGEPIYVQKNSEREKKRVELENSMNNITRELDKKLGLKEVAPA